MSSGDRFGARATLAGGVDYYRLSRLAEAGVGDPSRLPMTVKILLENALRHADAPFANEDDVAALTAWDGKRPAEELYDVGKDPYQMNNVAERPEYADVKKKLRADLDRWNGVERVRLRLRDLRPAREALAAAV